MRFRASILYDFGREKCAFGIEVLGPRKKWYGMLVDGQRCVFPLKYDACAFAAMLNEISRSKKAVAKKGRRHTAIKGGNDETHA